MRIGLVAPEFPPHVGGMAEFAQGLAAALAQTDSVRVHTLVGNGYEGAADTAWESGVAVCGQPRYDGRVLSELEGTAPSLAVDVWLALNAGLVPLARHLRAPFFCYFHGNDFIDPWLACGPRAVEAVRRPYVARFRHALRRRAIHRNLGFVRHLLTNSHQTAELIHRQLGASKDAISVVHPGVDDAFFQERASLDGSGDALRLLTVSKLSRHSYRKNIDGVLRAVALLRETVPITYNVVGDGDDRPRLEALAHQLSLADCVTFSGTLDRPGLLAAYRRADLFVLASKASKYDVEGFGIVYLEASASGVPVICSREGGATDAVADGRNGFLIDSSSPVAIAAGIRRFVAERERFASAATREFAQNFRWPTVTARLRVILNHYL